MQPSCLECLPYVGDDNRHGHENDRHLGRQHQCHQWNGQQRRPDTKRSLDESSAEKRKSAPRNNEKVELLQDLTHRAVVVSNLKNHL